MEATSWIISAFSSVIMIGFVASGWFLWRFFNRESPNGDVH